MIPLHSGMVAASGASSGAAPTVTYIGTPFTTSVSPHATATSNRTIPGGTELLVVIVTSSVIVFGNGLTIASVTVGGLAMTAAQAMTTPGESNGVASAIYTRASPPTGAQDIVVTYNQATNCQATHISALSVTDFGSLGASAKKQSNTDAADLFIDLTTQAHNSTIVCGLASKGADIGPYTGHTDNVEMADGTTGGSASADLSFWVGQKPAAIQGTHKVGSTADGMIGDGETIVALELKAA